MIIKCQSSMGARQTVRESEMLQVRAEELVGAATAMQVALVQALVAVVESEEEAAVLEVASSMVARSSAAVSTVALLSPAEAWKTTQKM